MSQYYFLAAALDNCSDRFNLNWMQILSLLKENLSASHWHQFGQVRRLIDLDNMERHWKGVTLTPYGFWSESQVNDRLVIHEHAEQPICIFLDEYSTVSERLEHLPRLKYELMHYMSLKPGLVGRYYRLRLNLEIAILGLRKRHMGEDPEQEISELILGDLSAKSLYENLSHYASDEIEGYEALEQLIIKGVDDPISLHKDYTLWLIDYWQQMAALSSPFSFERVLFSVLQALERDRFCSCYEGSGGLTDVKEVV